MPMSAALDSVIFKILIDCKGNKNIANILNKLFKDY